MRYLGGKFRTATAMSRAILTHTDRRTTYIEPFLGGGAVAAKLGHHFRNSHYSDGHLDLMLMWSALGNGWTPPTELSRDKYEHLRTAHPSPLRGFAGFGASYGGKWFGGYAASRWHPGGFQEDYVAESARSATRCLTGARGQELTTFTALDVFDLTPDPAAVIYCDPPYQDTQTYDALGEFDHARFWATAEQWARDGAAVYVSERSAPDGWVEIWSRPVYNRTARHDHQREFVADRLFTRAN